MQRIHLAIAVATAVLGRAQAPVFQALDTPAPPGFVTIDAIGDLDNDGYLDLLGPAAIALNDGHGRFTQAPGAPLAFARGRTLIVDLNGDGHSDVLSLAGGNVRIDLGTGGLVFFGPIPGLPSLGVLIPTDFAVGDVDADGDLDILIGTQQSSGTSTVAGPPALWLNSGQAVFVAAPAASLPAAPMSSLALVALRDLDGDGDLDAVFAGPDAGPAAGVRVLTNGGGTFSLTQTIAFPGVSAAELGNFDGDAFPDLAVSAVVAGTPTVAVSSGSPIGFGPISVIPFPSLAGVLQAVDLDGDGLDEILQQLAQPAIGVSAHAVLPGGVLGPALQSWPDLYLVPGRGTDVVHDLDGDLDRDVLAHSGSEVVAMMSDGAGALVRNGGRLSGVTITGRLQIGDVDGDGKKDLIGLGSPVTIATGLNDGDGYFTGGTSSPLALPGALIYYSLYTFDRDGDTDAHIYAARNVASVYGGAPADVVYDYVGGMFTPIGGVTGTGSTSCFKAADFDGDGDLDIVLGRRSPISINNGIAGPMLYLQNIGTAGFAPPVALGVSHATYDLDLGDFDGNGTIDIFQTNANAGTGPIADDCVVYLNSGSAAFTPVVQPGMSGFFAAAADLNGDGRADLVLDGQVFFSAGTGALTAGPLLASSLVAPATFADVDQDGALDLVETPGTVMRSVGVGFFGPPESYLPRTPVTPTSWDIPESFVIDLDRDGDPDLIAPGPIVLMNVTRQIAHGSIARPGRPASIDLYGTPNGAWALFASTGTAAFNFAPYGNVLIDPVAAVLGATGTFAGPMAALPGTATLAVITPNIPALVGWTTYWEGIDIATSRFTNRITITVMGY